MQSSPDRCATISGWPLWRRLLRRHALWFSPTILVGFVAFFPRYSGGDTLAISVGLYVILLSGGLVSSVGSFISDWQARRPLGERYGVKIRFGTASFQVREICVHNPPSDLGAYVEQAFRAREERKRPANTV